MRTRAKSNHRQTLETEFLVRLGRLLRHVPKNATRLGGAKPREANLSELGLVPRLRQLLLQVGPDAHLDVHDARRREVAEEVLQLQVSVPVGAFHLEKKVVVTLCHRKRGGPAPPRPGPVLTIPRYSGTKGSSTSLWRASKAFSSAGHSFFMMLPCFSPALKLPAGTKEGLPSEPAWGRYSFTWRPTPAPLNRGPTKTHWQPRD